MTTRFNLELTLDAGETLVITEAIEYLHNTETGSETLPPELARHLAGTVLDDTSLEDHLVNLIGADPIGIDIEPVSPGNGRVRIFDRDGKPNLRMLCQLIANFAPRVIPLEFTFAMIDEDKRYYSGGLVVMTTKSAEIQIVDSKLKRRSKPALH